MPELLRAVFLTYTEESKTDEAATPFLLDVPHAS
jgi:hypothetical protein